MSKKIPVDARTLSLEEEINLRSMRLQDDVGQFLLSLELLSPIDRAKRIPLLVDCALTLSTGCQRIISENALIRQCVGSATPLNLAAISSSLTNVLVAMANSKAD